MLKKEKIIELLETLQEHKMAKDIFVPALKAAKLRGVRFTGGTEEQGIDLEYYELTEPERRKSYVGIQFKKGALVYQSDASSKNSVQTVKNQAEEAFSKEMVDIEGHGTHFIGRFIVAVTREINEPARRMIGKARTRGEGRRIDFWDGDRLAETIQTHWMADFEEYFADQLAGAVEDDVEDVAAVVDAAFIAANHEDTLAASTKVRKTLTRGTWAVLRGLVEVSALGSDGDTSSFGGPRMIALSDLLLDLGKTEERLQQEFDELGRYGYIDWADDSTELRISGSAVVLWKLARAIVKELTDAEEDENQAGEIFDELVP